MASFSINADVTGLAELTRNLAQFTGEKVAGRAALTALTAGGRVIRTGAVRNARGLGLGKQGIEARADGRDVRRRYGRIPNALTVGRAYVKSGTDSHQVRVYARGGKGLIRNKAGHAHLLEYGFVHKARNGGRSWVPGRPFLHPALNALGPHALEVMTESMKRSLWRAHFSVTGRGK
jgi:hypothetical protein